MFVATLFVAGLESPLLHLRVLLLLLLLLPLLLLLLLLLWWLSLLLFVHWARADQPATRQHI